jgi:hypothetical protein
MRTRQGTGFWKEHWLLWKKSGLNQKDYCEKAEISYHSFRNYSAQFYRKQKKASAKSSTAFYLVPQEKVSEPVNLVNSVSKATSETVLRLNLQKGMSLDIPDGFNPETLYSFFKVVNAL